MGFDSGTGTTVSHAFTNRDTTATGGGHDSTTRRQAASTSSTMSKRTASSSFDISNTKEFKLQELAMLSLAPIFRSIHHWWLQRAERHYLICADVEQQRAREAQMNVAYYQKRAALARSARN